MSEISELIEKIELLTGWKINPKRFSIVTDTSDWMNIKRGDLLCIPSCNHKYVIQGNAYEPRFGIDDQPKYWVFHALELETGKEKIIKTVFHEEFYAHIGIFKIRCYRDPIKEANVLDFVKGDRRYMQGESFIDEAGNNVRVIDYIKSQSFFKIIPLIDKPHEQYFKEDLPIILWNLKESIEAIMDLHKAGFCHGDIRNDHILIDSIDKKFRWIDFDLKQDVTDFDLWSIGNILSYAVAKGIITFNQIMKSKKYPQDKLNSLVPEDGSAFYNYRLMNHKKLFDYIPDKLSNILQHFTIKPISYYQSINEFYDNYCDMLENDFPQGKGKIFNYEI